MWQFIKDMIVGIAAAIAFWLFFDVLSYHAGYWSTRGRRRAEQYEA